MKITKTDKEFLIDSINIYRIALKNNVRYSYVRTSVINDKNKKIDNRCDKIVTKILNL